MPVPPARVTPTSVQPRISFPPDHPFGADVRCVPCTVRQDAIRALLSGWAKRPRSTGPDEVSGLLGLVALATHEARFALSPGAPARRKADPPTHPSLGRRP